MYTRQWSLMGLLVVLALVVSACAAPGSSPAAAPAAEGSSVETEVATAPEGYANPDILIDTAWVLENLDNPSVALIEVGSLENYEAGHIPGAIHVNPGSQLTNPEDSTQGQVMTQDALTELFSGLGITHDTTVVIYDESRNLSASRAYWVLKYYQHDDVRIYNGGKNLWVAEGNELSTEVVEVSPSDYVAREADPEIRTTAEYVMERIDDEGVIMCDTRNAEEYAGTDVRADRGGHIPGAINIDWVYNVDSDGLFKSAEELYALYTAAGFSPDKQIITYCQTGVRGAHTWFVLRELLGFPDVRNYDGSWAEYGNRDDTPIQS